MPHHPMTIRAAGPNGPTPPTNLITIGDRRYRPGRSLIAEVDGTTVAAISLATGAVAADLDRIDSRTVRRLKYRRYEILRQSGHVAAARTLARRPG